MPIRTIALDGCEVRVNCATDAADSGAQPGAEFWPSMGEYPVYDDALHREMIEDEARNARYRTAIGKAAAGRSALDIGTGAAAIWARAALEAGARSVHAVEIDPAAFAAARDCLRRLGLAGRIDLIAGDSRALRLDQPVEVCVSELIGNIGGAEGAAAVLADAQRRLMRPGAIMIPHLCVTRIAALALPEALHRDPGFAAAALPYLERLLRLNRGRRDLRLCLRQVSPADLRSATGVFEAIEFSGEIALDQRREIELTITHSGRIDGFLLWIELTCAPGDTAIDSLRMRTNWRPAFFPVFYPGVEAAAGDVIAASCATILSDDGVHPDYRISGTLRRRSGAETAFNYESKHHGAGPAEQWPIYARLLP